MRKISFVIPLPRQRQLRQKPQVKNNVKIMQG